MAVRLCARRPIDDALCARIPRRRRAAKRPDRLKARTLRPARSQAGRPICRRPEIIAVRSRRVACDGVGGALGHPRVWLEMGEADFVECPYCDRRFVLATGAAAPRANGWRRASTKGRAGTRQHSLGYRSPRGSARGSDGASQPALFLEGPGPG